MSLDRRDRPVEAKCDGDVDVEVAAVVDAVERAFPVPAPAPAPVPFAFAFASAFAFAHMLRDGETDSCDMFAAKSSIVEVPSKSNPDTDRRSYSCGHTGPTEHEFTESRGLGAWCDTVVTATGGTMRRPAFSSSKSSSSSNNSSSSRL